MANGIADISGRRVSAKFYQDPTHGPVCERKIGPEAGADTLIEAVNDDHVRAYPVEFARFQASRASIAPVGISLKRGLGMDDDLVRLFNAHGVMDLETFCTISDTRMYQLMPGNPEMGIELRERAKLAVPEARRTPLDRAALSARPGPASREAAAAEIEELKLRLAAAERDKAEALALVEAVTAPVEMATDEPEDVEGEGAPEAALGGEVRRGPGRPRRAA